MCDTSPVAYLLPYNVSLLLNGLCFFPHLKYSTRISKEKSVTNHDEQDGLRT